MPLFYSKEHELKGKVALITGGTKNLGALTAEEFARLGSNLFLHYHSSEDEGKAKNFAEELQNKYSIEVYVYGGTLNTDDDMANFFKAANSKFSSGIDVAVNNIGKVLKKPLVDISEKEFDEMDQVNNKTAFLFLKEAGKSLNKNGKIVTLVTSLLAAYTPFYSSYQGTKAAVEYYTKSCSKEFMKKGISVNCVAPGPMDTPFLYPEEEDDAIKFYKTVTLHGRLTKMEDIVPIVRFLVTEGGWITGQTIYASGGFTAH